MVHYYFIVSDIVTTFHRLDGFSFFFEQRGDREKTKRRQKRRQMISHPNKETKRDK